MTLRGSYRPWRPDLDRFLSATVEDEIDGVPLSVVSALTRLGLDPWQEAGRLSSMSNREAIEQLARLIGELPGLFRPLGEAREIAGRLIQLLPRQDADRRPTPQVQILCYLRPAPSRTSQLWVACLVLAAAVLVSAFLHGGLPFGIGSP
jgi:hypothetical protein